MKRIIFMILLISDLVLANDITIIGDSLSVGASKYYKQLNPNVYIDAKIGRQFKEIDYIIPKLERENKLGNIIIIELGTNGDFNANQVLYWIDYLTHKNKQVVLVTVRTKRVWQNNVNEKIHSIKKLRSNIIIADWFAYSKDKSFLFSKDGTHLTNKGYKEYAKFILSQINQ